MQRFLSTFRLYLFMTGFLFVAFIIELLLSGYEKYRLYNALENLILAIGLLSFCRLIFPKSRWPLFQVITCVFVLFIVLLEGVYFLILGAVFSPSAIFIAMETNVSETFEFAQDYFSFDVLFYVFAILVAGIFMIRYEAIRSSDLNYKWLYYAGILGAIIGLRHPLIYPQNLPFTLSTGIMDYWATSFELNKQKANKYGGFTGVSADLSGDELYVFVIGESTNRNHMQIYGYDRETTPKLTAVQDELTIFKDVISSHAYTIASLTTALRLTDKIKEGNIIQLLNAASFDTFWLSNQAPIGLYETLVTKIGMTAQNTKFTSSETWFYKAPHDDVVLPHFKKFVKKEGSKVIFVHLLGTHGAYYMRYPGDYKKFDPDLKLSKDPKIDHYDNAVLYNDYIVSEIINITKASAQKSFVLYFSDHGEEVFDEIDYAGHSVDQNITKNMFEVPFVLWQSKAFQKDHNIEQDTDIKFSLEYLAHAIADLCGVQSNSIDYSRSLFNKNFKPSPRIILDSLDYDLKLAH